MTTPSPTWTREAVQLIKDLSLWQTSQESEWEPTDDPYIDNTMSDIDEVIQRARTLARDL